MPDDEEQNVSWLDVAFHLPVIANDGREVGRVVDVAALPNEDIFHGIVFEHGGHHYLAPADDVLRITNRAVSLAVDSKAAERYEEFHPLHVSRLGVRGIFAWKHLGWKESPE